MNRLEDMIKAVTVLHKLEQAGIVKEWKMYEDGFINYKFLLDEELEEADIEACEIDKIETYIEKETEEYWQGVEDERQHREDLENDYWAVQGVRPGRYSVFDY